MQPNIPNHHDRRPGDYPTRQKPKYGWRDDDGKPIHDIDEAGNPVCGRLCNTTRKPCQRSGGALAPNGRCVTVGHGGKSTGGPIKHGRYSIFLPTRLAAKYEAVTRDDVINNVHENIAIMVAMIQDKLTELGQVSGAELWKEANEAFDAVKMSIIARDEHALYLALDKLSTILLKGSGVQQKEKEILDLMHRAGRLTKVEITKMDKLGHFMTPQQMLANQANLIAIVKKHVDKSIFPKIAHEIDQATYARYG